MSDDGDEAVDFAVELSQHWLLEGWTWLICRKRF
jgi:hypothetical protein